MLQFVREIPIRIVIEGASSVRRGFLFYLAAGFHKEIEPLSGMSADLVMVDQWLGTLKKDLEQSPFKALHKNSLENGMASSPDTSLGTINHSLAEIMAVTRLNLMEKAEKEGVVLKSLRFREERGWSFSWNSAQSSEEMIFSHTYYLETFTKTAGFDLLKVTFSWARRQGCEFDYYRESLRLLKVCQSRPFKNLHKELNAVLGSKLPSGSFLNSIEVNHLGEQFSTVF